MMEKNPFDLRTKERLNTSDDKKGIIVSQQEENKHEVGNYVCTENREIEKMQLIAKATSRRDSRNELEKKNNNCEVLKLAAALHDKVQKQSSMKKQGNHKEKQRWKEKLVVSFLMLYMGLQAFLPYSHFITKVRVKLVYFLKISRILY